MKNYPEREVNNARRQLNVFDQELKEVESKVADLEIKNQQYTHDLVAINKVKHKKNQMQRNKWRGGGRMKG